MSVGTAADFEAHWAAGLMTLPEYRLDRTVDLSPPESRRVYFARHNTLIVADHTGPGFDRIETGEGRDSQHDLMMDLAGNEDLTIIGSKVRMNGARNQDPGKLVPFGASERASSERVDWQCNLFC
ncbi:MAG: hypothetical protein AAFW98_04305, partial [Pseudomonadota bacterium]